MSTALQLTLVPSLDAMGRVVDALCRDPDIGQSRQKQLRALLGAYERAFALGGLPPDAYDDLPSLLAYDTTRDFFDLAVKGLVRGDGKTGESESDSALRARGRCLELIAAKAGVAPFELPPMPPTPALAPVVTAPVRHLLLRHFQTQVDRQVTEPFRVRFLAMYGVVLDTASSSGALAAQHMAHLAADLSTLRVHRPRQGRTPSPPPEEWPLSTPTRQALAAYLQLRTTLVEPLENPVHHLWVTLEHNHIGYREDGTAIQEPPGVTLRKGGIQRVFARAAELLNDEMEELNRKRGAGRPPEWQPMPTRLEPLRRAVALELQQREERQGDAPQLLVVRGRPS
ncbi:hypothetical protein ACIQ9R_36050 [Streptomyces sp. NPDC094447]|uniref:hypothetical protein n=1 Tax=Streptomyces sp. NPDC094447 TaxID=3366062 RepID=UPI0038251EE2